MKQISHNTITLFRFRGNMITIILNDIITEFMHYIPYAASTGIVFVLLTSFIKNFYSGERKVNILKHYDKNQFLIYLFYIYIYIALCVTIFSRAAGSRIGVNIHFFGTFSHVMSQNIYPVENILLFIPFGLLLPLVWKKGHSVLLYLTLGFLFSLLIELVQLLTGRGFFQIDDIMTNVIGTGIGYVILSCVPVKLFRKCQVS